MQPKVIVICTTYNHEKFLAETLEGFVTQKTNFPFQVLVGEDCSPDGTAKILREYAEKYPDIIRPFYRKHNLVEENFFTLADEADAPYVAICEGDDYWTDCEKLQKQADFMDEHPEYTVSFHPVRVKWEGGTKHDSIFPPQKMLGGKTEFDLNDLLRQNFIQTNSVMYRWRFGKGKDIRKEFPSGILPGDWFLHLLHAEKGKIGFMSDIMAVYRKHNGGIWAGAGVEDRFYLQCALPHLKFYRELDKRFDCKHTEQALELAKKAFSAFLRNKRFDLFEIMAKDFTDLYNQCCESIDKCWNPISRIERFKYKWLSRMTWGKRRKSYKEKYGAINQRIKNCKKQMCKNTKIL